MMTCGDELHIGQWCAWCQRFVEDGDIGDSRCRDARERLARKIEDEMVPQPSHAAGWLFAIVVLVLCACAAVL